MRGSSIAYERASDVPPVDITQLSGHYGLAPSATRSLSALLALLRHDASAPTSVRDEQAVLNDHLADSLVALELSEVRAAQTITDLGSGAGLPGLALAAALPEAAVWLVESNGRKCGFLKRAQAACGLENVTVVNTRAELWREGFERSELVTARAVGPLPVVAEYAAPLLRRNATLVVWRGARDRQEEAAAARAAGKLGLEAREPLAVSPYAGARRRHLHLMSKVRDTPDRFPRRPGVAAKRPLA
jgi:16S rRNA (guanine527-N7)-methyltransferase